MINKESAITVRVGGVPEHFNLPWRLALEDGAFAGRGIDLLYEDFPGGTGAMTRALNDGSLDMALVLTEGAVLDSLTGNGNRLVKVYVESPLTWGIHVAAGSDIESIEQIENRPVAISRYGSGSHLIAIVDAMERGFDAGDMHFVVVDNLAGAREALAAGKAEIFLWEKHMTQPLVDAGEFRRVGERAVPWPAFVVSVRPAFLEEYGRVIREILDVVGQYATTLAEDPDAAALISERYGISLPDAAAWLETVRWHHDYACPAGALARIVEALRLGGVLDEVPADPGDAWSNLPEP